MTASLMPATPTPTPTCLPRPHAVWSTEKPLTSALIACLDGSYHSREVARAAADLAQLMDRPLLLFHAVEHPNGGIHPPDPFEWNLRHNHARRQLDKMRQSLADLYPGLRQADVGLALGDGDWPSALSRLAGESDALVAIGVPGAPGTAARVAHVVAEADPGLLLLVPHGYAPRTPRTARIAVPLDGSNFAEAALAEAARLALRLQAELLLIHVIPDASLSDFGPPASSDLELRMQVDQRNERVACTFLEKTQRRLSDRGLAVRSLCLKGDPRVSLVRALGTQRPDLVVLASKGQGGRQCDDLSIGSTASYLLDHLTAPFLLVGAAQAPLTGDARPRPRRNMPVRAN